MKIQVKALTGTLAECQERYNELDGKIQRDKNGIEQFDFIYLENGLVTLVWVAVQKKIRKQPSRKDLLQKLTNCWLYEYDVIKDGEDFVLTDSYSNKIVYKKGSGLAVSRFITKMYTEKQLNRLRFEGLIK